MVVPRDHFVPNGAAVKSQAFSSCSFADKPLHPRTLHTLAFGPCELEENVPLSVYVFVTGDEGKNDGTLIAPVDITVRSNAFASLPILIGPVTPYSVLTTFTPSQSGLAWSLIMRRNSSHIMNASAIKSRNNAVGSDNCGMSGVEITQFKDHEHLFVDCDIGDGLLIGEEYSIIFYVEGVSGRTGSIEMINTLRFR